MKRSTYLLLLMVVIIFVTRCGKNEAPKPSKIVEDAVGATAIKQGEVMKKKLNEFSAEQQKREKELDSIR